MTIANVWPISGLSPERCRIIESSKRLGSGGFSVVLELSSLRVLKLTCCEATQKLLHTLRRGVVPRRARRHLPRVFETWGVCATDSDGMLYRGYVLERLFKMEDLEARHQLALASSDASGRSSSKWNLGRLRAEATALGTAQQLYTDQDKSGWESAVDIANALLATHTVETREAFGFLREFCIKQKTELDLCTPGNVLFGGDLRLVLADPVTMTFPFEFN